MKHIFINNYRKSAKQNTTMDNTKNLYFLNNTEELAASEPDVAISVKEINKKIHSLEDGLRIPFEMYLSGYKYKEIAKEMNLNLGTVKSRIFFSRKKLMQALEEYSPGKSWKNYRNSGYHRRKMISIQHSQLRKTTKGCPVFWIQEKVDPEIPQNKFG